MPVSSLGRFFSPFLISVIITIIPVAFLKAQPTGELKVRLLNGPFFDAQQVDLKYMMSLEPDRFLAPFLREAGLKPKAESYPNWENTGLDGHVGGHYISALALMYESTGNMEVLSRLEYMLNELEKCQQHNKTGYIGGIPKGEEILSRLATDSMQVDGFGLNKLWVPWYNLHKLFVGLRDAWWLTSNPKAKELLVNLSAWTYKTLSPLTDEQFQNMLVCEHGGMNEVLADVSIISGDPKFLELAKRFSHRFILEPLLKNEDQLDGLHANTQIPKVIGFKRISDLSSDQGWSNAAKFFWETVVQNRTVAIGGNSVKEHFIHAKDFTSMISDAQGPETCNTYNMLRLTEQLHHTEQDAKYADYYERALFNHILSSQHPEKGGFVYFTSMRPNHYRVYSQPDKSFWCCVGSGMENHAKYNDFIYSANGNSLYVNLFMASTVEWKKHQATIEQQTNFPAEGLSSVSIKIPTQKKFMLHIRYPSWVEAGALKLTVNGKPVMVKEKPGTYIGIDRKWNNGDKVVIEVPMKTTLEQMPGGAPYFAVMHGPIVLAAKTSSSDLDGLFADDSRNGHIAQGKLISLDESPVFRGEKKSILSSIKPVGGKALEFTVPSSTYPANYRDLKLVPFYSLHDSRYVVYWKLED